MIGYAAMSKTVTLSIDGQEQDVSVLGGTVRDVLASQDIALTDKDVVAPSLDSSVGDGATVAVKFARPLDVTVDGEETRHWVTATDVASRPLPDRRAVHRCRAVGEPWRADQTAAASTSRSSPPRT